MPDRDMLTVFAYDISQDRRRQKVARILEKVAARVQDSVFEVRMSRAEAQRTATAIEPHLAPGDSLRLYTLAAAGQARSRVLGDGAPFETDAGYWLLWRGHFFFFRFRNIAASLSPPDVPALNVAMAFRFVLWRSSSRW